MGRICGYACVSSSAIARADINARKNTKAYRELAEICKKMGISESDIYIDLITTRQPEREIFQKMLKTFGEGDCVVITGLNALGTTKKDVKKNYQALFDRRIGLLIRADGPEAALSTAGFDGRLNPDLVTNKKWIKDVINAINSAEIKSNKGRPVEKVPDHFYEVYWLYENYFLPEPDSYKNRYFSMGKRRFHSLCDAYERSGEEYTRAELKQDEKYRISEKPKRNGAVPEFFPELMKRVEIDKVPLSTALSDSGIPFMTEITYKRYALKCKGGKSAMSKAGLLRNTPLAKELCRDVILEESSC